MNQLKLLKSANSKSTLVKAILMYQKALLYYADENNWAVRENPASNTDDIIWLASDDPTAVANKVLGRSKPQFTNEEMKVDRTMPALGVREPDKQIDKEITNENSTVPSIQS